MSNLRLICCESTSGIETSYRGICGHLHVTLSFTENLYKWILGLNGLSWYGILFCEGMHTHV